jgi:hypothetical protein
MAHVFQYNQMMEDIILEYILGMCGCAFGAPHVLSRSMTQVKPAIYMYRYSALDVETERHRNASFDTSLDAYLNQIVHLHILHDVQTI